MSLTAMWVAVPVTYLLLVLVGEAIVWRLQPSMDGGIVLRITTSDGAAIERTVYGHRFEGKLYVSSNHWFRRWYHAALARAEIEISQDGTFRPFTVTAVTGQERARVSASYKMGALRIVTGFAPSRFLRLDPKI